MKNLLSTTALIAGLAFAGAAFAEDDQTDVGAEENTASDADAAPYASTSLLDSILSDAAKLSASISNISQNLNDIDGSITVDTSRTISEMAGVITALKGSNPGFGSFSQVNASVYASDLPASLLAVLNPLTLELGNLSTTAIGTLQSGDMIGKFDSDGLVSKVTSASAGGTTSANMLAEQYAGIAGTIAMQNVSVNSGAINGSVNLVLDDVNTKVGAVSTTAIGALQSGAMNADIAGAMGLQSTTLTTGIVNALVGSGTN